MRHLAVLLLAALLAVGCASAPGPDVTPVPTSAPSQSATPVGSAAPSAPSTPSEEHLQGEPLDPPPIPDAATCDGLLRAEEAIATSIRTQLRIEVIATDAATVAAVARDPAASTKLLGIPLTDAEAAAYRKSWGASTDPVDAIHTWIEMGASNRLGGLWIDPPGSQKYVVAIVNGDPGMLAIARCLERADTRYVWANLSLAEGRARAHRVATDMQALRAQGIEVNSVSYLENEGSVVVGVTHPSSELLSLFLAKYGPPLRLEEEGPVVGY